MMHCTHLSISFLVLPFSDQDPDKPEEYILDIENPENNRNGILVIRGNEVVVNDATEMVDVLTIYKPLFDLRDAEKSKACLLPDWRGIQITEPKVPLCFSENAKDMHRMEGKNQICEPTLRAHLAAANDIRKQPRRQQKQVIMRFPDGLTCNAQHFNGKNKHEPCKLKNNVRTMETVSMKEKDIFSGEREKTATVQFIFWKVVIEAAPRRLEDDTEEESDGLKDAFTRMAMIE